MTTVPFEPKIDTKNGVIDGRDFALRCMIQAYRLLGAYAQGDRTNYERLKGIIAYRAEMEIHMNDEDVPSLMMIADYHGSGSPAERWQQHLTDTANATEVLLSMADAVPGRHWPDYDTDGAD